MHFYSECWSIHSQPIIASVLDLQTHAGLSLAAVCCQKVTHSLMWVMSVERRDDRWDRTLGKSHTAVNQKSSRGELILPWEWDRTWELLRPSYLLTEVTREMNLHLLKQIVFAKQQRNNTNNTKILDTFSSPFWFSFDFQLFKSLTTLWVINCNRHCNQMNIVYFT